LAYEVKLEVHRGGEKEGRKTGVGEGRIGEAVALQGVLASAAWGLGGSHVRNTKKKEGGLGQKLSVST